MSCDIVGYTACNHFIFSMYNLSKLHENWGFKHKCPFNLYIYNCSVNAVVGTLTREMRYYIKTHPRLRKEKDYYLS